MSVMVRFSMLGRLEDGGEVFCVVPLSFVGVRDELSESCFSSIVDDLLERGSSSVDDLSS